MFKKVVATKVVKKATTKAAQSRVTKTVAKKQQQTKKILNKPKQQVNKVKGKVVSSISATKLGQKIDKTTDRIKKQVDKGKALFQKNPKLAAMYANVKDRREEIKELAEDLPEAQGLRLRIVRSETVSAIQYSVNTQTMIIHFNPIATRRKSYPDGFPSIVVFDVDDKEVRKFQRADYHMRYYNENYSFAYSPRKFDTATLAQAQNTLTQLEQDGRKDPAAMLEWRATFESYRKGEISKTNINKAKVRAKKAIKERKELFAQMK